jgi:peptidoglycan L-alanyl-D-glutamate endopeptidase CwlK
MKASVIAAEMARYASLHEDLKAVVSRAVATLEQAFHDWEPFIVSGHRTQEQQDDCVRRKTSRCMFPNSPHNQHPSLGVDIMAVDDDGKLLGDVDKCKLIAEAMKKAATDLGIAIRWGGDFKKSDFPHFELAKEWDAIRRNPKALTKGATK